MQNDAARQVVAATRVPGDDRPHTVSAVADLGTGQVSMFVRPDPLLWLAMETRRELGLAYGLKTDADEPVWRLRGRVDMARIKAARFGVDASVDSDGDAFAGVGVAVRW
ncbi:MAG: hypothetical protein MZW92_31980 [Comamonadaceae bacterium]|nr:hypothetical protein [Comamonadaceae bacterium]